MSGNAELSAAYLLHYTAHRDTSFITDFFTLDSGLVTMYARGARSGKYRALYQPFRPLYVSWVGDQDLKTLTGIEASGAPIDFNDTAMACAYYFNELLLRLLPKFIAQPALFGHYLVALNALQQGGVEAVQQGGVEAVQQEGEPTAETGHEAAAPVTRQDTTKERLAALQPTLRLFELQVLDAIGVVPEFGCCANNAEAPEPDERYRFYPSLGRAAQLFDGQPNFDPFEIHREGLIRNDAGVEVSGRSLLALAAEDVNTAENQADIKRIMRPLLRIQLGDRPLKSRRYFESLLRE